MLWLFLLLIFVLIMFCIVFYLNNQDIMAPSVMVCLVFIFSISLALYNSRKWKISYSFESFAILASGIAFFGITDILVAHSFGKRKVTQSQIIKPIHIELWKLVTIALIDLVVVVQVFREVVRIAATNSWFTNIFYAYRIITSHSENLKAEQYMNGLINQSMKIVIVSGFLCAFLFINNVFICREKIRKNITFLAPPILMCIMTLCTGVRTNVLRLCVFCLITGYILLQYRKNWKMRISWKFIRVLAISLLLILVLFGGLQSVLGRSGSTDIISVTANYAGAPVVLFDQYIQDPPAKNEVFGQETFTGMWNVFYKLGITDQLYSAHEEYRYVTSTDSGNVYTLFRRFVQDFGVAGMVIMTILLAAIFSMIYNGRIKHRVFTYKRMKIIIEYGYLFYIVAMASVDNSIHDYINIGTIVMIVLLNLMLRYMFNFKVRFGEND